MLVGMFRGMSKGMFAGMYVQQPGEFEGVSDLSPWSGSLAWDV